MTLAHGAGGLHDLVLTIFAFVAPAVIIAILAIVGKIRGED